MDKQDEKKLRHPDTRLTGRVREGGTVVEVKNPHGAFWVPRAAWRAVHGVEVGPGEVPPGAKRNREGHSGNGRDASAAR